MDVLDKLYTTDEPLHTLPPPKKPGGFFKRLVGMLTSRFFSYLIVSLILSGFSIAYYAKIVLAWVFKLGHALLGDPGEPPAEVQTRLERALGTARARVPVREEEDAPPKPIRERIADIREKAESRVEGEVREKVLEKVAPVKVAAVAVKDKVEDTTEAVRDEAHAIRERLDNIGNIGGNIGDSVSSKMHDLRNTMVQASVEHHKRQVYQQAATLGIDTNGRTLEEIQADIMKKRTELGPNGQCPYCHNPVKVPSSGSQRYACRRCHRWYTGLQARHAGPPANAPMLIHPR